MNLEDYRPNDDIEEVLKYRTDSTELSKHSLQPNHSLRGDVVDAIIIGFNQYRKYKGDE